MRSARDIAWRGGVVGAAAEAGDPDHGADAIRRLRRRHDRHARLMGDRVTRDESRPTLDAAGSRHQLPTAGLFVLMGFACGGRL